MNRDEIIKYQKENVFIIAKEKVFTNASNNIDYSCFLAYCIYSGFAVTGFSLN